jgi:hypothetical protein
MPTLGGKGRGWMIRTVDRPRQGEEYMMYCPRFIGTESLRGAVEGVVHRVKHLALFSSVHHGFR